jgi:hypothetical protein
MLDVLLNNVLPLRDQCISFSAGLKGWLEEKSELSLKESVHLSFEVCILV